MKRCFVFFLSFFFFACGGGSGEGGSSDDNAFEDAARINEEASLYSLTSCPETTYFSDDSKITLGEFSDMAITATEDSAELNLLTSLTGNDLDKIVSFSTKEAYSNNPSDIMIFGNQIESFTTSNYELLQQVFTENKSLIVYDSTKTQLECLRASLNFDSNKQVVLTDEQESLCNDLINGDDQSKTFGAFFLTKKDLNDALPTVYTLHERTTAFLDFDLAKWLAEEDPKVGLTQSMCSDFQFFYETSRDSHQSAEIASFDYKLTEGSSVSCPSNTSTCYTSST